MSNINIRKVKDAVTKEEFYPQTCIEAVVDENGDALGIDASPADDSNKLVRSGGVKAAIDNEATARANADSALGIRIDGANTGIQAAMAAVSAEQQRAVQAENAKYVKPAGGIPKVDLASDVQASLELAQDVVYDISAHNNNTAYDDLAAALGSGGANVPQSLRKGGMSVRFVLSSDNNSTKYVQYRLMASEFSTDTVQWQGVEAEPVDGSKNLVESGGVAHLAAVIATDGSPLNYVSTIYNKYPNYQGHLVDLDELKTYIFSVEDVEYLLLRWADDQSNINFGILFSNDPTFESISSYVAPYAVTNGSVIIKVPNNVSYVAFSRGYIYKLDGRYENKIDTDIIEDITSIKEHFNDYTPLTFSNMLNGFVNKYGGKQNTQESSSFRMFLYAVEAGQVLYFKQNISSPYAYYAFCDDNAATRIISYSATNYNEFLRLVVPNGANYFIVNGGTQTTGTIPNNVSVLGEPFTNFGLKEDKKLGVYNYFPAYSFNNIILTKVSESQIRIDDSFAIVGASKYIELDLSSQKSVYSFNDFREQLKITGKIRVCFDCICTASSFNLRLYTWGGSRQYYEKTVKLTNTINHIDEVFEIPTSDFDSITRIELYFFKVSGTPTLKVTNIIITDDIYPVKPYPLFSKDWDNLTRSIPNLYNTCIYIGDSISTSNNYQWKGIVEDVYTIKYVRDGSSLNPANGGITVRPSMADESSLPNANKSIWYRCAQARMSNKNFDIINLFGGQNDKGVVASGLLGTINDKPYVDDASTFDNPSNYTDVWTDSLTYAQCYMGCIEMLKRDFPGKELFLMSIYPTRGDSDNIEQMAILQCQIAYKYDLKITPLYWDIFRITAVDAFTRDGVHPNSVLARQMAIRFSQTLGI